MNDLMIATSKTIILSNKNYILLASPDDDYPNVLVRQRGKKVNLSFIDSTDVDKVTLKDFIGEDRKQEESFTVEIEKLNELLEIYPEDIIPRLVELMEDVNLDASPERILETILIIKKVYSADYILSELHNMSNANLEAIFDSYDPMTTFREIVSG